LLLKGVLAGKMGRTTAMTSTVGAAPMTKGQRSLRGYREPAPARPLPAELRSEAVLCFDARRFDLAGAVASLLGLPSAAVLETYVVEEDSISGRSFPKSVHDRVRNSAEFVERYEALIREVVGPHLLSFFPGDTLLLYQFPPTLRVHCSVDPPKVLGRMHSDSQYGHQAGEINFWLPLTNVEETSTLWAESAPGLEDWRPFLVAPGEIKRFHGCTCRHLTRANGTGRSRVSLDFRCAARSAVDAEWQLPGVAHRHEMREMQLAPVEPDEVALERSE